MRITILQGAFLPVPPLRGGAVEKMWFALGREFARREHAVTHVSRRCDGLAATETIAGVRHVRVEGSDQPARGWALKWRDWVYSRRAVRAVPPGDIVVTNTFWSPLLLAPRQGGVVVDVQRMPKGQMRLYRRARRLRANSSAVAKAIAAEAPGLADRIRVIPNPLPFEPERGVDWERKEKRVLFAGRLHPEKGIELLLEAWRKVRERGRLAGWTLGLVGPRSAAEGGGGEPWVEGLRRKYNADNVEWSAPVYDSGELNRAYERAAVLAYPSLAEKGETFGLAVLEAMAWGAVPVVSDLACFRDFVVPERNGFVFDHRARDAADRLASAIERAAATDAGRLARAATEVRETHSIEAIATQFLEDFATIVAAPAVGI